MIIEPKIGLAGRNKRFKMGPKHEHQITTSFSTKQFVELYSGKGSRDTARKRMSSDIKRLDSVPPVPMTCYAGQSAEAKSVPNYG